jgi:hypothetical protein
MREERNGCRLDGEISWKKSTCKTQKMMEGAGSGSCSVMLVVPCGVCYCSVC